MINKINKLPQSEFVKVFANIFEKAKWIAEELYLHRPFNNFEELSSKMLDIFEKSITLEDGFEYKNKSNKFELEKYEKSIIENISSRLSKNIIEQLYSI